MKEWGSVSASLTAGENKSNCLANYLSSIFHHSSRGRASHTTPIAPLKMHATTPQPRHSSPLTLKLQRHQLFRVLPCCNLYTETRLFLRWWTIICTVGEENTNASRRHSRLNPRLMYPSGCNKTTRWIVWNGLGRSFVTRHHRGDVVQLVPALTVCMLKLLQLELLFKSFFKYIRSHRLWGYMILMAEGTLRRYQLHIWDY